jgi:hypothetical protein
MRLDETAVRRTIRQADRFSELDWILGAAFYPNHREWIEAAARAAGADPNRAIDASARASVRTMYAKERETLLALLTGKRRPRGILRTNWKACRKALRAGLDAALVGDAPKVRCYRAAIGGDESRAVIDTHIARFLGRPQPSTAREYAKCERIIQAAARRLGVPARTLQAALWYNVRGVKPTDPS